MKTRQSGKRNKTWLRGWAAIALAFLLMAGVVCVGQAADKKSPLKLALVTPLSPPGDVQSGEVIQKAAKLWVDQMNAKGGIDGHPVEMKAFDTMGKPSVGSQAARRAIVDYGASAIIGSWAASVAHAETRVAHRDDVPILFFYSWPDKLTKQNFDQVFRIGPYNSQIARGMLQYVEQKGYKRVAMLAEDSDYGAGFADAFEAAAKGSKVDFKIIRYPTESQDLTPELSKIKHFKADALIIEAVYAAKNLAIKQAREVGLNAQIITGWDWPTLSDFWPTVGKAGKGVIYVSFTGQGKQQLTSVGKKFRTAYEKRYDHTPAIFLYFLTDTLNALKESVEATGSTKAADLVKALPKVSFTGTTGKITFTRDKGTVRYNQWDDVKMYFKQLPDEGDTASDAKLVYTVH